MCGLLVFRYALNGKVVKVHAFHKVAHLVPCHVETHKVYVVGDSCDGGWHVQLFANVAQFLPVEIVVCQKLTFVHNVACNFVIYQCFCPNFHTVLQGCFVNYTKYFVLMQ